MIQFASRNVTPVRATLAAILVFAFGFSWYCGARGLSALDQSIVFDGASRILAGQIPFRDFVTAHSVVPIYLQALFFFFGGVSWRSTLLAAALANAAATFGGYMLIRRVCPRSEIAGLVGALITAVWFFPPMGTLYSDQMAALFGLYSMLSIAPSDAAGEPRPNHALLGGALLALAFYSKQNAGIFLFPIVCLLAIVSGSSGWAAVFMVTAAFVGTVLIIAGMFAFFGSASLFFTHYFVIPFGIGVERILANGAVLTVGVIGAVIISWCVKRSLPLMRRNPGKSASIIITGGLIVYCEAFVASMSNNPGAGYSFIGIIAALLGGIAEAGTLFGRARSVARAFFCVLVVVVLMVGVNLSWQRRMLDETAIAKSFAPLAISRLEGLLWGNPTVLSRKRDVSASSSDIDALTLRLSRVEGDFFVFPDYTFLYGALGRAGPQPLLWFHRGLTYPNRYDESLDRWVVEQLKMRKVSVIVLEAQSMLGTDERRRDFPQLDHYLNEFKCTEHIGPFQVCNRL